MPKSKHDPGAVDAYLAGLPEAERTALEDLRELIKSTVPDVQERISYGTSVIFALERDLVGFVAQLKHLSFFTMSPELATAMRDQIKATHGSGGNDSLQPGQPAAGIARQENPAGAIERGGPQGAGIGCRRGRSRGMSIGVTQPIRVEDNTPGLVITGDAADFPDDDLLDLAAGLRVFLPAS